jgi:hypothetical protein
MSFSFDVSEQHKSLLQSKTHHRYGLSIRMAGPIIHFGYFAAREAK